MFASIFGMLFVVLAVVVGVFALLWYAVGATLAMAIFFVLTCMFMILVILIQKPKGGGLSGAFGGAGGAQQGVFGAKAGDALTVITIGFFVVFLGLAMGLVYSTRSDARSTGVPIAVPDEGEAPVPLPTVPDESKEPAPAPAPAPEKPSSDAGQPSPAPAPAPDAPKPAAEEKASEPAK